MTKEKIEQLIEKLASYMHDIWSNWFTHQRDNSTIKNLWRWRARSEEPTEEREVTSFQILDMFSVIISELSKYHSYKNIVKELEYIKNVIKDDFSKKIIAS